MLGEVEETIYVVEDDDEEEEEIVKVVHATPRYTQTNANESVVDH